MTLATLLGNNNADPSRNACSIPISECARASLVRHRRARIAIHSATCQVQIWGRHRVSPPNRANRRAEGFLEDARLGSTQTQGKLTRRAMDGRWGGGGGMGFSYCSRLIPKFDLLDLLLDQRSTFPPRPLPRTSSYRSCC